MTEYLAHLCGGILPAMLVALAFAATCGAAIEYKSSGASLRLSEKNGAVESLVVQDGAERGRWELSVAVPPLEEARFALPEGETDAYEYMRKLCYQGYDRRFSERKPYGSDL